MLRESGRHREVNMAEVVAKEKRHYDVAIVGAGVSGTYAAWRLANSENYKGKTVALFEGSDRIGGRLYTLNLKGSKKQEIPGCKCTLELGGMRFLERQKLVSGLVNTLGLVTADFKDGSGNHNYYVRGARFNDNDVQKAPWILPYRFQSEETGKTAANLVKDAFLAAIGKSGCDLLALDVSREEVEKVKTKDNVPLFEVGLWNILSEELSPEAQNFAQDLLGFNTIFENWNAAEAVRWFLKDLPSSGSSNGTSQEIPAGPKFITGGYETLPRTLLEEFKKAGGAYFDCYLLSKIETGGSGRPGVMLRFERTEKERKGKTEGWTQGFKRTGDRIDVRADQVILALGRRALELIDFSSLNARNIYEKVLPSISAKPASKLILAFKGNTPEWWERRGGYAATDLPLRQCYPILRKDHDGGPCPVYLLLAGYNDGRAVEFWNGYLDPPRGLYDGLTLLRKDNPKKREKKFIGRMLDQAHKQLIEVFGPGKPIPEPTGGVYMDWTADPYGGGWHFWRPGFKVSDIFTMLDSGPFGNDVPIYLCGEAWSPEQGWVEGALKSAERLLRSTHFRLGRDGWQPEDYDLVL
jgi:monoamine oxidase